MFWPDINHYRQFYRSPLGTHSCRQVRRLLASRWPQVNGGTMLGMGYCLPYLLSFQDNARTLALMPAQQGMCHWPKDGPNRSFMSDEDALPFADGSVDCVLMVHLLEHTRNPAAVMQEVWRVLAPNGRVLVLVPNRTGLWARMDNTPLGYGAPYSGGQLHKLFEEQQFTPLEGGTLFFNPPSQKRLWLRYAGWFDFIGQLLLPFSGGIRWLEGEKQLYAPLRVIKPGWQSRRIPLRPSLVPGAPVGSSSTETYKK